MAVLGVAALVTVVAILAAVGVFNGHAAPLASSGPGWSYNAATKAVVVSVKGTVLSGLSISSNLTIKASNVTVKNVQVVTGVTIENSTISGQNATTGRVDSAIKDVYGDSTGWSSRTTTSRASGPPCSYQTGWWRAATFTTPVRSPAPPRQVRRPRRPD